MLKGKHTEHTGNTLSIIKPHITEPNIFI
uniref:Uncharacterized protein n=1 Tax=Anguilla anguilla TaxID=7936 RepID=A0A0E9TBF7_ANGAN